MASSLHHTYVTYFTPDRLMHDTTTHMCKDCQTHVQRYLSFRTSVYKSLPRVVVDACHTEAELHAALGATIRAVVDFDIVHFFVEFIPDLDAGCARTGCDNDATHTYRGLIVEVDLQDETEDVHRVHGHFCEKHAEDHLHNYTDWLYYVNGPRPLDVVVEGDYE